MATAFGLESQATAMNDDGVTLSTEEFVEYCRIQAGLLSERIETIGAEIDELLAEIDDDISEIRTRVAEQANGAHGPAAPPTSGPDGDEDTELEALETEVGELEAELERKEAIAEAKRARMAAFEDLAAAYLELAEDLQSTVDDGREALDRVVRFEREHDAPAYFDDRQTVLEAAAESAGSSEER